VLTGFGVGEGHLGGFAQKARVKSEWLVPLPASLSLAEAMAIGTAGFTAMLCVQKLETFGMKPADGPVVVTGAAGGVGSVAVALLKKAGWHVIASTGRPQEADYLKGIGADEIIDRAELSQPGKPLGKPRWAAGVDTVGSHTLANVLAQTKPHGAVAACGNAQGLDLPASVAPFILRGVALLGVDSVYQPKGPRIAAWNRLASDLDRDALKAITTHMPFDKVMDAARDIVDGKVRGRVVIDVG
jgi:acrylyl-CoA reductase (NADPH)